MSLIEFKNVSFAYPNGFLAVDNINFAIEENQNIAIVGQNGAGKTTTVKMINGLIKPTEGQVIVNDLDTADHTTAELSRQAGYVFQNPDDQIFHNTVRAEIEFGPRTLGFDEERIEYLVKRSAELTKIEEYLDENPYNLPLSIRKFVTIASVIAMDTPILIFDEPTAGQDLGGLRLLNNLLTELKSLGKTIITITHDMDFVKNNFDFVYVMANKKLLDVKRPNELFLHKELLDQAMLTQPFITELASELDLGENILSVDDFVKAFSEKY